MKYYRRIGLAIIWAVSLMLVAEWAHSQARIMTKLNNPVILSGSDVGFRVEGRLGETPVGTIVLKINGEWIPAEFAGGMKALKGE